MFALCHLGQVLHHRHDLLGLGLFLFLDGLCHQQSLGRVVDDLHRFVLLLDHFVLRDVFGAAPCGLAHGEVFVVAHLQVEPAGVLQAGGVRALEHVLAVAGVLHAQADAELGVAPDLVVDHAGGLLGGQDQVDAQASADAGGTDQLVHELRLLAFQLGKLVRDDEQVRQGFLHPVGAVQALIIVDVQRAFVAAAFRLVEDALAAFQLALDGDHRAGDGGTVQVGDGTHQMRQMDAAGLILKGTGQAAALVVDEQEGHLVGAEVDRHGQDVGDDELRLAGAGHAGHQAVGALTLFVQVQHEQLAVGAHAHRRSQAAGGVAVGPALEQVQVFHLAHAEHLQEGEGLGQAVAACDGHQAGVGQLFHAGKVAVLAVAVQRELLGRLVRVQQVVGLMGAGGAHAEDAGALLGLLLKGGHHRKAHVVVLGQHILQHFQVIVKGFAQRKHHIVRVGAAVFRHICLCAEGPLHLPAQVFADGAGAGLAGGQEADGALVVPHMGQVAHLVQGGQFFLFQQEDALHLVVAVGHHELGRQAAHKGQHIGPVAHHAADVVLQQGGHHRGLGDDVGLLHQRIHLRFQRVLLHLKALLRVLQRGAHGHRAGADAQSEEVVVGVAALPQAGDHALEVAQHAGHVRVVGVQHVVFVLALFFDLLLFGFQIFAVFFQTAGLIFLALLFGVALGQEGEDQRGEGHAVAAHHDGAAAHDGRRTHAQHQRHLVRVHGHGRRIHCDGRPLHGITTAGAAVVQPAAAGTGGNAHVTAGRVQHRQHRRADVHFGVAGADGQKVRADDDAGAHQVDHIAQLQRGGAPHAAVVDVNAVGALQVLHLPAALGETEDGMVVADEAVGADDIVGVVAAKADGHIVACTVVAEHAGRLGDGLGIQDILAARIAQEVHLPQCQRRLAAVHRLRAHKAGGRVAAQIPLAAQRFDGKEAAARLGKTIFAFCHPGQQQRVDVAVLADEVHSHAEVCGVLPDVCGQRFRSIHSILP